MKREMLTQKGFAKVRARQAFQVTKLAFKSPVQPSDLVGPGPSWRLSQTRSNPCLTQQSVIITASVTWQCGCIADDTDRPWWH